MAPGSASDPAPGWGGGRVTPIPPPKVCVRLSELVARAGGELAPFGAAGGGRLAYALPAQASAEVLAYLRPLAEVEIEPDFVARLPAGRVYGDGAVLSADGNELARDVSLDFGLPFARHWLLDYPRLRAPEMLAGSAAVVAVKLGSGYCHWLLEELPRLLMLPPGEAENLVAHAASPFAREALAGRGGAERVIEARRHTHLLCAPLIVPGLVGLAGRPTPTALGLLDRFCDPVGRDGAPAATATGERIYLTRDNARRRRVGNEGELRALLEARGFVTVRAEELAWAEQIAVFRRARVVVAPHGAGLANLAFCAPGTRVVELVNRAYFNPYFWRLAGLRGLDYRPVVTAGADEPIREDPGANRLDIVADLAQVRAALAG